MSADTRNARYRERNQRWVVAYLRIHPCVDCGEDDPLVLDFDHVRGVKVSSIANLAMAPCGLASLRQEAKKCDIRCANCHRRKTYQGSRRWLILQEDK